ncbi:hypothetical protein RTBOTA2_005205 [Rhodotorula toruloides]|nr:hypothetical protein RTBOTA2_005205 [Rhodotorula toruloides]
MLRRRLRPQSCKYGGTIIRRTQDRASRSRRGKKTGRGAQRLPSILEVRKISANEADQLGDLSTLADPSVVDQIKEKFASVPAK